MAMVTRRIPDPKIGPLFKSRLRYIFLYPLRTKKMLPNLRVWNPTRHCAMESTWLRFFRFCWHVWLSFAVKKVLNLLGYQQKDFTRCHRRGRTTYRLSTLPIAPSRSRMHANLGVFDSLKNLLHTHDNETLFQKLWKKALLLTSLLQQELGWLSW